MSDASNFHACNPQDQTSSCLAHLHFHGNSLANGNVSSTTCMHKVLITPTWREANFSATQATKQGCRLLDHMRILEDGRPNWLTQWEHPALNYYRFS
ncbi:hypothetical protein IFM89_018595 [Coptis chinensis]|uniref:Uncharacterized protein n=1 Tax=Coptis chinensis TaxID=261450 RepID=A0A835I4E4_9MAGN|nr:hypothetical protein IFM89_018595 [Coptis chinensis]